MSDYQKANPSNTLEALNTSKDAVLADASQAAGNLAGQARQRLEGTLSQKKGAAADGMDTIAHALRQSKRGLEGAGPLPDLAEKAADGIEKVADYFQNRSVVGVVRDVEAFGRREPALFLGLALALGLAGGRFLKSSARPQTAGEGDVQAAARLQRIGLTPPTAMPAPSGFGTAGAPRPTSNLAGSSFSTPWNGAPRDGSPRDGAPRDGAPRDGARPIPPGRM